MAYVTMPDNARDAYPSNSHKSREQRTEDIPKAQPIVKSGVKRQNKSLGRRLADTLVADSADNIFDYVIWDILVPAAKDTLANTGKTIIDMALYGERRRPNNVVRDHQSSYVAYNRSYDSPQRDTRSPNSPRQTRVATSYVSDDIILDSRTDAEDVLEQMQDAIEQYGDVSVAYLYQLVGMPSQRMDNYYGWSNLRDARVVSAAGGGWMLDLPRARAFQ